jgi:hypothetical protein
MVDYFRFARHSDTIAKVTKRITMGCSRSIPV